MGRRGLRIESVAPDSPGMRAGLRPGDEILSVNGHPVPDELALKFHLAEERVTLEVRDAGGRERRIRLELSGESPLGVQPEEFRTRTCNNACLFCFIDQLPPGARQTLQVKDDDYRLSFLHGNYITLTNLPDRELDRIIRQALSPLYVSVHATEPALRTKILGRSRADDLDGKIRKLTAGGIRLHTQIVLMPGINDGGHLDRTVEDLYGYRPGVGSIAVVPLGLSDHGSPRHHFTPVTPDYCRGIIRQVAPWQDRFRKEIGRTFVYLADEFYIQGEVPLPATSYYDAFEQIEDGIGMVRKFLNDFKSEMNRRRRPRPGLIGTVATGGLFFPYLSDSIADFNRKFGSRLQVRRIPNTFMGREITVAGLLAGVDFQHALKGTDLGRFVIIPQEAVSRVDGLLVDNVSPRELSSRLGTPVHPSGATMHEFFKLLCEEV